MKAKRIVLKIGTFKEFENDVIAELGEIDKGKKQFARETTWFESAVILKKILSEKRLTILHTIKNKKPSSIFALAKMVSRNRDNVHRDVKLLSRLGLLTLTNETKNNRNLSRPTVDYQKMTIDVVV